MAQTTHTSKDGKSTYILSDEARANRGPRTPAPRKRRPRTGAGTSCPHNKR